MFLAHERKIVFDANGLSIDLYVLIYHAILLQFELDFDPSGSQAIVSHEEIFYCQSDRSAVPGTLCY